MTPTEILKVKIGSTGEIAAVRPGDTLLAALSRLGYRKIPVGCRTGGCGVCKVHIQEGEYETGKMSRAHLSVEEENRGFVLACRCEPKSDLKVEIVGQMRKRPDSLANENRGYLICQ